MSVEAMALVLHHSRASGTAKLVLLGIANHAGDGGAWPTIATLARYANTTERTVQRAIAQLVKLGEVRVHPQAGGLVMRHFERPNRYDVLLACPAACDRTTNHRLRSYPQAVPTLSDSGGSDPVTLTSPGDTDVTGAGDADVTHNRPTEPVELASVSSLTKTRASEEVQEVYVSEARAALRALRVRSGSDDE